MTAIFECKKSGNRVAFRNECDIESMRKEPGYFEVKEQSQQTALPVVEQSKPRLGRPRKVKADVSS